MSRFRRNAGIAGAAMALVAGFEGLRTVAYEDAGPKLPTICYGETRGVKMGDTATMDECKAMLDRSLAGFSTAIDRCLPHDLPEATYVAFLSAAYNIGPVAFCGSSMARKAHAKDLRGACDALLAWNKTTIAGVKVPLPGLTRRRKEERALCLEGVTQ